VIQTSQATKKGIWINAPVSATVSFPVNISSYVYNLALLMKNGNAYTDNQGVPSNVPIYLEHSNEVWNYGFGQYVWNKLAATDECNTTTCDWNNDGETDPEIWAQRRHIAKAAQIGQNFVQVFGAGSFLTQIRPIYADVYSFPNHNMSKVLTWFNNTYGPPSNYFYGISVAGYYGGDKIVANMTIDDVYANYKNGSDALVSERMAMVALANKWGLKFTAYESGPGWNVGTTDSVAAFIMAQRFAQMRDVYKYDVLTNWVPLGGDVYNQFSLAGYYSRYGQWGSIEHMFNTSTPKYCACMDIMQVTTPPSGCNGW
jgi:hypothetical protein